MTAPLSPVRGIHHVTAIARDAQANVDFYAGVLGLRWVKRTVNFDDPGSYHLYYGDPEGTPGSILTFFAWPGAPAGRAGSGQVAVTSFLIPPGAMGFWVERLRARGIALEGPARRLDEEALSFRDPDGLPLELVAREEPDPPPSGWAAGNVPPAASIRRFAGVTLWEAAAEPTARLLTATFGFAPGGEPGKRHRLLARDGPKRAAIDLVTAPEAAPGRVAAGSVHHVAWRVPDPAAQDRWRGALLDLGFDVTPVIDRKYFLSIYFREPGGILFELATDPPGFAVDEAPDHLGEGLMLPPWLEPSRARIEHALPALRPPAPPPG